MASFMHDTSMTADANACAAPSAPTEVWLDARRLVRVRARLHHKMLLWCVGVAEPSPMHEPRASRAGTRVICGVLRSYRARTMRAPLRTPGSPCDGRSPASARYGSGLLLP